MKLSSPISMTRRGFTLVELMISMAIISLIMLVLVQAISSTESVWSREAARVSEYEEARGAMETVSRRLAEATLDSCWAYTKDAAGRDAYVRASDGHLVSGRASTLLARNDLHGHAIFFQAPFGHVEDPKKAPGVHLERMDSLLNCMGYYVEYQSDLTSRPAFLSHSQHLLINPERRRFCLMEFRQPAEDMILFSRDLGLNNASTSKDKAYRWFRGPFDGNRTTKDDSSVIAENILGIILEPEWLDTDIDKNTTVSKPVDDCYYDTREVQWGGSSKKALATQHQLPPTVRMTLIATEEKAYQGLEQRLGPDGAAQAVQAVFANRFSSHKNLEREIEAVEQELTALKLDHRIFTTTIALRGSKWIIEKTL